MSFTEGFFFQKSKPAKEEVELTRTQSLPMKVFFVVVIGCVDHVVGSDFLIVNKVHTCMMSYKLLRACNFVKRGPKKFEGL